MFYKTPNGAMVGDLFMSLTHTCELNGVNSFHYLTELQGHADGSEIRTSRLDAVELWRNAGADEILGRGLIDDPRHGRND